MDRTRITPGSETRDDLGVTPEAVSVLHGLARSPFDVADALHAPAK